MAFISPDIKVTEVPKEARRPDLFACFHKCFQCSTKSNISVKRPLFPYSSSVKFQGLHIVSWPRMTSV